MTAGASRNDELLRLAQELIAIPSHADVPGMEAEIATFLVEWFESRGIRVERMPVEDGRANIVARIPGGAGPSLMLNGHLDTVPAGSMADAFVPTLRDGVLQGRGACDMKGAVASMCLAMAQVMESGRALAGDLLFTGTIGEETGSLGVKRLVSDGIRADYAIVGEPTCLRPAVAHKGASFLRITLHGRGAHGSRPEEGISAVSAASRIVARIEDELRPRLAARTHPLLGASTVSVGRVCGGTLPNVVAECCEIDIDRRTIPGEDGPLAEIEQLVKDVRADIPGLTYTIEESPATRLVPHVPLGTPATSRLARSCRASCRSRSLPDDPVGMTYWTDGGHLSAHGMETIVFGPGDIAHAHGPADRVRVSDLHLACEVYLDVIASLLTSA